MQGRGYNPKLRHRRIRKCKAQTSTCRRDGWEAVLREKRRGTAGADVGTLLTDTGWRASKASRHLQFHCQTCLFPQDGIILQNYNYSQQNTNGVCRLLMGVCHSDLSPEALKQLLETRSLKTVSQPCAPVPAEPRVVAGAPQGRVRRRRQPAVLGELSPGSLSQRKWTPNGSSRMKFSVRKNTS